MKNKKIIYIMLGALLATFVLAAGLGVFENTDTTIELSKEDKSTLAGVGVAKPQIEELVCDGTVCRACASDKGYGMGCISIPEEYCSSHNETSGECLKYTKYTQQELLDNRDEAFKVRWENIADAIRQRQDRAEEVKLGKGNATISEKK